MSISQFNREIMGADGVEEYLGASIVDNGKNYQPKATIKKTSTTIVAPEIDYDKLATSIKDKLPIQQNTTIQQVNTEQIVDALRAEIKNSVAKVSGSGTMNIQPGKSTIDTPVVVFTGENKMVASGKIGEEQSSKISNNDLDMLFDILDTK